MTIRTCGQCNAPLPKTTEGEALRCEFCGAVNEAERSASPVANSLPKKSQRPTKTITFIGVFVAMIAIAVLTLVINHHLNEARNEQAKKAGDGPGPGAIEAAKIADTQSPLSPPLLTPPPQEKKIPVAELSRAPLDLQQDIDAPPPPAEMSRFDILANLEWATRIATAWSTDAAISDFEVRGLRADGTVDLTIREDFEAVYDFMSPTRRAAAIELSAVTEKTVSSSFSINIRQSRVRARAGAPSVSYLEEVKRRPPIELGCSAAEVVQAALKNHLPVRPFWMIEMTFDDTLGWSWIFDYDHEHPIRAKDCTSKAEEKKSDSHLK
jgi:hypothetical protein